MTSSRTRGFALAVTLVILVAPLVTGIVGAVQGAGTNSSELAIDDLERGGEKVPKSPPSTRWYSETESFQIRHDPGEPLASKDWYYLGQQQTVRVDELELRAIRGGDAGRKDFVAHIAYWNRETQQVRYSNGTTVTEQVANVTQTETQKFTLGSYYSNATLDLSPSYEETQRVSICVQAASANGNCLKDDVGIRWGSFVHKSNPAKSGVPVDSKGDILLWLGQNILLWAVPGTFITAGGAKKILKKTGAGPMLGTTAWALVTACLAFVLITMAWFFTATLLARAPQVIGVLMALMVGVIFLEAFDGRVKRVLFERQELTNAKSPSGEDVKDTKYEDMQEHRVVQMDDDSATYQIIKPGFRPFLARLFASGAKLDESDIQTQVKVREGKWDRKYIADPGEDELLKHTPARLSWNPPLRKETDKEGLAGMVDAWNWEFLVTAGVSVLAGWYAVDLLIGLPTLGALLGMIPGVVMSVEALDGEAEFVPAPEHTTTVKATINHGLTTYKDAKTIEALEDIAWDAQAQTHLDALALQSRQGKTVTARMHEQTLGLPSPGDSGEEEDVTGEHRKRDGHSDPTEGDETTASDSGVADD